MRPLTLTVAAGSVGLQAVTLLGWAVAEAVSLDTGRAAVGVTTTVFFLGYAVALAACCRGLLRRSSWARSPVVLTQLIQLGLAWSFRDVPLVAVPLALVALATLGCLLAPPSIAALEPHEGS